MVRRWYYAFENKLAERDDWFFYGMIIVVLLMGILLFSIPVKAHDWYPIECCSGMDCAPVDNTAFLHPTATDGLPQHHDEARHR